MSSQKKIKGVEPGDLDGHSKKKNCMVHDFYLTLHLYGAAIIREHISLVINEKKHYMKFEHSHFSIKRIVIINMAPFKPTQEIRRGVTVSLAVNHCSLEIFRFLKGTRKK